MRFLASLFALSLVFLTLAGCPAARPACPPDGTGFAEGVGLYCAYGVVIGGFRECPMGLPNRFDFPDGSFVCSDRTIGSRDAIPDDVCAAVSGCVGADPCVFINRLPPGAPCTEFGWCHEPGDCSPSRRCVEGAVEVHMPQCDGGVARLDVSFPPDVLEAGVMTDAGPSDVGVLGDVSLLCGSPACRGDEVCRETSSGTDGGTPSHACLPLPPSCVGVADCTLCNDPAQRACLGDVCFLPEGSISSGGRLVVCRGA